MVSQFAGMAKLVDALVLGTSGQPWGFESLYPHQVYVEFSVISSTKAVHLAKRENRPVMPL